MFGFRFKKRRLVLSEAHELKQHYRVVFPMQRQKKGTRRRLFSAYIQPLLIRGCTYLSFIVIPWFFYAHIHRFVLNMIQLPQYRIEKVSISQNYLFTQEELIAMADIHYGSSLFAYDVIKAKKKVESYSNIKDVSIKIKYPDTIVMSVRERTPMALIVEKNAFYYTDREGFVLSPDKMRPMRLPRIFGLGIAPVPTGQKCISSFLEDILAMLDYYTMKPLKRYFEIDRIYAYKNKDIVLHDRYGNQVRLSIYNYRNRLDKLQLVIDDLVRKNQKVSAIDLRFKNAIVRMDVKAEDS